MDTNFSPELKKVLADSTKQALRHNVAVIQPEHLLMALISDSDSKGFRLIEKAATSSSAYALQQNLDKYLFEEALNTYGDASAAQVSVSDMSNRLIKLSVLEEGCCAATLWTPSTCCSPFSIMPTYRTLRTWTHSATPV